MTDEPMDRETYDLFRSLTNITPSPDTITVIEELRQIAKDYGRAIIDSCPSSREKSLAKTHLEESVMWAVKSLILNQPTSFESK